MGYYNAVPKTLSDGNKLLEHDVPRLLTALEGVEQSLRKLILSVQRDLVELPDKTWSGDAKNRCVARSLELSDHAASVRRAVLDLQAALRTKSHTIASLSQSARRAVAAAQAPDASAQMRYLCVDQLNALAAEVASTQQLVSDTTRRLAALVSSHAASVAVMRDTADLTTAAKVSPSGALNEYARRVVTSKKSTPSMIAAALLTASGAALARLFDRAVRDRKFSRSFVAKVKEAMLKNSKRAALLNTSIADWKQSDIAKTRHPVFINLPVFSGPPKPTDIIQGAIGDCWVLASFAALANRSPELIENMIQDNYDGTYRVTFGDGSSVEVSGDVWLQLGYEEDGATQVSSDVGEYAVYARSSAAQWPWILEKAMAARFGGYGKLDGGIPVAALNVLVGPRGFSQQHTAPTIRAEWKAWDRVEGYIGEPEVSVIDADRFLDETLLDGLCVIGMNEHAYAVLGTETINGEKWVKLYNPWGTDAFSDGTNGVQFIKGAADDGLTSMRVADLQRAGLFAVDGVR
jgi:hypothetical protein